MYFCLPPAVGLVEPGERKADGCGRKRNASTADIDACSKLSSLSSAVARAARHLDTSASVSPRILFVARSAIQSSMSFSTARGSSGMGTSHPFLELMATPAPGRHAELPETWEQSVPDVASVFGIAGQLSTQRAIFEGGAQKHEESVG